MADSFCFYCRELIAPEERIDGRFAQPVHYECGFRSIMGCESHLRGLCSCFVVGGQHDPKETTPRQSALAAFAYWQSLTVAEREVVATRRRPVPQSPQEADHAYRA